MEQSEDSDDDGDECEWEPLATRTPGPIKLFTLIEW